MKNIVTKKFEMALFLQSMPLGKTPISHSLNNVSRFNK